MKLIFENLTAFQNIMFVISALAFVLLVSYLIILQFKNKQKEVIVSDDIDSQTEPFEDAFGFIFSAFKIKGCLFLLFFGSISIFLFSLVLETWLAVLIGLLVGCVSTVIVGFIDRKPVGEIGELATVSVEIPAKGKGTGRVILLEDNSEIEAESIGRAIKKGKKVVVVENLVFKVVVKKIKKMNFKIRNKKLKKLKHPKKSKLKNIEN